MTVYADTSVIGAVIFDESESERARDFFRRTRERVIVSDLARLEFAAVVSRLARTGKFSGDQSVRALASFDMLRAACLPMTHGPRDFAFAEELVRDFSTKLVAPDALHLASARSAGASLATFDKRLAAAARMHALDVAELG